MFKNYQHQIDRLESRLSSEQRFSSDRYWELLRKIELVLDHLGLEVETVQEHKRLVKKNAQKPS